MKIEKAFELVLDMAEDTERDCSFDPVFEKGIGPETLNEMREAIKTVRAFVNG